MLCWMSNCFWVFAICCRTDGLHLKEGCADHNSCGIPGWYSVVLKWWSGDLDGHWILQGTFWNLYQCENLEASGIYCGRKLWVYWVPQCFHGATDEAFQNAKILSRWGPVKVGLEFWEDDSDVLSNSTKHRPIWCAVTQLMGSLLHFPNTLQPSIAYILGHFSRFMPRPTKQLRILDKHVRRYLCGSQTWECLTNQGETLQFAIFRLTHGLREAKEKFQHRKRVDLRRE